MPGNLLCLATGFVLLVFMSCQNEHTPKPRGYFRIDLPEKNYELFNPDSCPYAFEKPVYATVEHDANSPGQVCWYDINFRQFSAKIHLSYHSINNNLSGHIENCRMLAYKHTVKAEAIDENLISNSAKTAHGLRYDIAGNAASSIQFFLTDSTKHFLRGALYFNCPPQSDSLKPVIEFCKQDIEHLVNTIRWK